MKNLLLIGLLLTTSVIGAGSKPVKKSIKAKPTTSQETVIERLPIILGIIFTPITKYTADEIDVLATAERLTNEMFQSSCFERFMLNRKLRETNGRTRQEVVDHLKAANLSVPLEMYYNDNNVIGYRIVGKPKIYTNRKFHAGATACARSANLNHETAHTLGYGHSSKPSKVRPFSVNYSITAAFKECCVCKVVKNSKGKEVHLIKDCSIRD